MTIYRRNAICTIGLCTFGVYLFERIWRHATAFIFSMANRHLPTMIACLIWIATAVCLGVLSTFLLKRVIYRVGA